MKGSSNIVQGFNYLKKAHVNFQMFINEHPNSLGTRLIKRYQKQIDWIKNDLITEPFLPDLIKDGLREEWAADEYAPDAIIEKVYLLSPTQRELMEKMLDLILKGEPITVEIK